MYFLKFLLLVFLIIPLLKSENLQFYRAQSKDREKTIHRHHNLYKNIFCPFIIKTIQLLIKVEKILLD